jgi:signal transduction histidine kinase
LERKSAVFNAKKNLNKKLSDCAKLIDVNVLDELQAYLHAMERSIASLVALAPEGIDSFTEEPMDGEAEELYEGKDEDTLLYTTDGYAYYYDESGTAQWYDLEATE